MRRFFILAGILMLVGSACKDLGTSYEGLYIGSFNYSALDTAGTIVTTGSITLYRNDSQLSGNWRFTDGRSGELKGTMSNGEVYLDFNPRFIDNNLILRGISLWNTITGSWSQVGISGVLAKGVFIATKQ